MKRTDRLIFQAIKERPDSTACEIAACIFYTCDCIRKHLRREPLSKMIAKSGVKQRAATYRMVGNIKFCETCGQVIE